MIADVRRHRSADTPNAVSGRPVSFWVAWAICALSTVFGGMFLFLLIVNSSDPRIRTYEYWGASVVFAFMFPLVGALIVSRYPQNWLGWVFLLSGFATGAGDFAAEYAKHTLIVDPGAFPGSVGAAWFSSYASDIGFFSFILVPLLFPDGRPVTARWRVVVALAAGAIGLNALARALLPGPLPGFPAIANPLGVERLGDGLELLLTSTLLVLTLGLVAGVLSVALRYQRADATGRQQLKWFLLAVALVPISLIGNTMFPNLAWLIGGVAVALVPLSIGIAVLRHRLYDVDAVINRTLVYGTLSAGVIGLYVLVVVAAGAILQTSAGNLIVSVAAAGLVAALFQPVRERLQRAVNQMMYGDRDDPYGVLSRLGQQLRATIAPHEVLPSIVDTVAQSLNLPYVAIILREDDGSLRTAAEFGLASGDTPVVLPLANGNEALGQLVVAPRAPGEPFSSVDQRLLDDLARRAESAIQTVRLARDLQRSKERLISVREEERRRLRRDLHDGLGPQLATLTLKLDAARNMLTSQPAIADALLVELKEQAQFAISEIRRLVNDLRPRSLDELGLVPAIRALAESYEQIGVRIVVEGPDSLPALPAAVEVAAFRIAQEGLMNVIRHAQARTCQIRLTHDGDLWIEITDDGVGLPAGCRPGVGLTSMRERAAELGGRFTAEAVETGGTRITARLPLHGGDTQ